MDVSSGEVLLIIAAAVVSWAAMTLVFALRRISWARLEERVSSHSLLTKVEECVEHERQIVTVCLAATLIAAAALTATVFVVTTNTMGAPKSLTGTPFLVAGAVSACSLLLLGWIFPALMVLNGGEGVVTRLAPLLARILLVLARVVRRTRAQAAGPVAGAGAEADAEETEEDLAETEEEEAREMLRSAARMRSVSVAEIMTPRTDMVSVESTQSLETARRLVVECGHSRLPVWGENRDDIIGVLYAKDLLRYASSPGWDQARLTDIMREAHFVPETKRLTEMLEEFQRKKVHIGIVLDEYGGTSGLVTIEDIIEEIIGEIHDEYDVEEEMPPVQQKEGALEVDARLHVEELNEVLNTDLPQNGDFETVGGYLSFKLGRIPQPGEEFVFDDLRFTVLTGDARKVDRVRVEVARKTES